MTSLESIIGVVNKLVTRGFEAFGFYYGTYKGFVAERNDPKFYSRLKLIIPNVTGDQVFNYWAWPANAYAGKGYGSQVLPQVGDLIWVEFEQGNTRRPIWKYGYFGKDADGNPEKPTELQDYDNYWFRTPGGHLVELDDTTGFIKVTGKNGIKLLDPEDTEEEPLLLGNTTEEKIDTLIEILLDARTNTSLGPQPLFNVLTRLTELQMDLDEIKSDNKTIGK